MSHLTIINDIKLQNKFIINRLCKEFSWSMIEVPTFINPYSNEKVENANIFTDKHGTTKLVLDEFGCPAVDSYFMGHEYKKFIQKYITENLKEQALLDGGIYRELGVERDGTIVVEIEV